MAANGARARREAQASATRPRGARYVAFLRGINLGKRRPSMAQLKALFEELGFSDVATFIASGNIVFTSGARDAAKLETQIGNHLAHKLGYEVLTFVRSAEEVLAIGATRAFPEQDQPGVTVHVALLREPLRAADARALESIRTKADAFRVIGREYYWLCRIKTLESTVWDLPEWKRLELPAATMRNMTSVRKLIAKHFEAEQK